MCKECKELQADDFLTEWFQYMLGVMLWSGLMFGIGLVTWGLIYKFDKMIGPVSLIGGGIFFFFILPIIIHKLIHKK